MKNNKYQGSILLSVILFLSVTGGTMLFISQDSFRKREAIVQLKERYTAETMNQLAVAVLKKELSQDKPPQKQQGTIHFNQGSVTYQYAQKKLSVTCTTKQGYTLRMPEVILDIPEPEKTESTEDSAESETEVEKDTTATTTTAE